MRTNTKLAGLATMIAAVSAAAAVPTVAHGRAPDALEPASRMSLVVVEGLPGSEALLRGDYELGLEQSLEAYRRSPDRNVVELSTNICAAQAKLGDFAQAHEYCQRAMTAPRRAGDSTAQTSRHEAVILVNQGVLRALQGQVIEAREYFSRASRLFPSLGVADSNLELVSDSGQAAAVAQD